MIQALIPALIPIVSKIVGNIFPDPEAKAKAEAEVTKQLLEHTKELEQVAGEIIKTEAASTHWLAANWRPLLMLLFGGLIAARWFGYSAPNITEAEYLQLWEIVKIGIGGYIVGRSAEKIIPNMKK